MAVDGRRRAAEVEVDALGAQRGEPRGVVGQAGGVGAQQLGAHRRAGRRSAAVCQFGHESQENTRGQQLIGDADELRDASVDPAGAGQHVAHAVVDQALHRGQQQLHGRIVRQAHRRAPRGGAFGRPRAGPAGSAQIRPGAAPRSARPELGWSSDRKPPVALAGGRDRVRRHADARSVSAGAAEIPGTGAAGASPDHPCAARRHRHVAVCGPGFVIPTCPRRTVRGLEVTSRVSPRARAGAPAWPRCPGSP